MHDGNDAGDFRTLKNFSIRDFVIPPDVERVTKASGWKLFNCFHDSHTVKETNNALIRL